MRVKSALSVVGIAIIGIALYSQTNTSTKQASVVPQQVKPTRIPDAFPNRTLQSNERFIASAGLYISVPEGMNFRQEGADYESLPDARTAGFYIEQGEKEDPTYQLYGLYQASINASEQGLERSKKEMDSATIKDVTIGGYKGTVAQLAL